MKDFSTTRSFHSSCYLSDHAVLRSKVSFYQSCKKRLKPSPIPRKIDVQAMKSVDKRLVLSGKHDPVIDSVQISEDVEASWKSLKDATYTTSLEVLGLSVRKYQNWFDENNSEIQALIGKNHHLHKLWITDKNSASKKTRIQGM